MVLISYGRMLRRLIAQLAEGNVHAQTMHKFVGSSYHAQTVDVAPTTAPYIYDWM